MLRQVLVIVSLCGVALGAGKAPAPKLSVPKWVAVGDKFVAPKERFDATGPIEVRNLRFADAIREDTGAHCTIVSGELWNMTPTEAMQVVIEIEVWRWDVQLWRVGTLTAKVARPGSKVPAPFKGVGPPCWDAIAGKGGCKTFYIVHLQIEPPPAKP